MYKVMIVDDEILVRIGLRSMIDWEKIGFQIVGEAGNGETAYEQFLVHRPDVLITDIRMPQKDGLWLIEKVKELKPETEVIVLTAYDEFDYARRALQLQASDYLLKAEMEEQEIEALMTAKREKLDRSQGLQEVKENVKEEKRENQGELLLGLLLNEEKPLEMVKEKFREMGIPWNQHRYCFIQLDFASALGEKEDFRETGRGLLFACLQLIVTTFLGKYKYCFAKQFGTSITCFLAAENLEQKSLAEEIHEIHRSIEQYFDIEFKSASTKIEHTVEACRQNSSWIFQAADRLFCAQKGSYISQQEYERSQNQEGGEVYSDEQAAALTEFLINRDEPGFRRVLERIWENCRDTNLSSLDLKLKLIQLVNVLGQSCKSYISQRNPELLDYQKKILAAGDLENLFEILENYLEGILECIESSTIDNVELLIRRAENYVEQHYMEKLTLEEVASHLGISPYYFSNLFRKSRDIKFTSYLTQVRMEHAKKLLVDPKITVSEVCEAVGFNDQPYFSKNFKKYTGMTITEYRERSMKNSR